MPNQTDYDTVAEKFLNLLMEQKPELKGFINNNYDKLRENLTLVLEAKFPDLNKKSFTDPEDVKQLTSAFSMAVILDQPNPASKKTLRDELMEILKTFGLVEGKELKPENLKKLTAQDKEKLQMKLEQWSSNFINQMQNEKFLPQMEPAQVKQLAKALSDFIYKRAEEEKPDQALINIFGMDPTKAGSLSFPALVFNGTGYFTDMNPNMGTAQIDEQNDPYGQTDDLGIKAGIERNYLRQLDTIADSFLGVLVSEGHYLRSTAPEMNMNPPGT